jgi:hypothetical protein
MKGRARKHWAVLPGPRSCSSRYRGSIGSCRRVVQPDPRRPSPTSNGRSDSGADSGREPADELSRGRLFHPRLHEPSRGTPGWRSTFQLSAIPEGLPQLILSGQRYRRPPPRCSQSLRDAWSNLRTLVRPQPMIGGLPRLTSPVRRIASRQPQTLPLRLAACPSRLRRIGSF